MLALQGTIWEDSDLHSSKIMIQKFEQTVAAPSIGGALDVVTHLNAHTGVHSECSYWTREI